MVSDDVAVMLVSQSVILGMLLANLLVQNIMRPVTVINSAVCLACPLIFWLFTQVFHWGFVGAAMANNVTALLTMLSMLASVVWIQTRYDRSDPKRYAWNGLSSQALQVS